MSSEHFHLFFLINGTLLLHPSSLMKKIREVMCGVFNKNINSIISSSAPIIYSPPVLNTTVWWVIDFHPQSCEERRYVIE